MTFWWVGLGLPVLVHLLFRRRGKVLQVGDSRFLPEHPPRQRLPSRLNQLLLLAARLGLLGAVALALLGTSQGTSRQDREDDATSMDRGPRMASLDGGSRETVPTTVDIGNDAREGIAILPAAATNVDFRVIESASPATAIRVGFDSAYAALARTIEHEPDEGFSTVHFHTCAGSCADREVDIWIGNPDLAPDHKLAVALTPTAPESSPSVTVPGTRVRLVAVGPRKILWAGDPNDHDAIKADLGAVLRYLAGRVDAPSGPVATRSDHAPAGWLVALIALLFVVERYLSTRRHA